MPTVTPSAIPENPEKHSPLDASTGGRSRSSSSCVRRVTTVPRVPPVREAKASPDQKLYRIALSSQNKCYVRIRSHLLAEPLRLFFQTPALYVASIARVTCSTTCMVLIPLSPPPGPAWVGLPGITMLRQAPRQQSPDLPHSS